MRFPALFIADAMLESQPSKVSRICANINNTMSNRVGPRESAKLIASLADNVKVNSSGLANLASKVCMAALLFEIRVKSF